jgi:hypothetical protein
MGDAIIDPPLQVALMLRSLLSTYHGVVEGFKPGCHSLTTALLQTVVDQCTSYDKDQWKGPVGKDGKPSRSPSANAAGTFTHSPGNNTHPFEAMDNLSFNKHLNHLRYNCKDGHEKCLICWNTSCSKAHSSKDCPILKRIGFKLVKRTLPNTNAMSCVGNDGPPTSQTPAPMPAPTPSDSGGSGSAPGAFTVAMDPESYNSGNDFEYEGKHKGKLYVPSPKPKLARYLYLHIPHHLCSLVSLDQHNTAFSTSLPPTSLATNQHHNCHMIRWPFVPLHYQNMSWHS